MMLLSMLHATELRPRGFGSAISISAAGRWTGFELSEITIASQKFDDGACEVKRPAMCWTDVAESSRSLLCAGGWHRYRSRHMRPLTAHHVLSRKRMGNQFIVRTRVHERHLTRWTTGSCAPHLGEHSCMHLHNSHSC